MTKGACVTKVRKNKGGGGDDTRGWGRTISWKECFARVNVFQGGEGGGPKKGKGGQEV